MVNQLIDYVETLHAATTIDEGFSALSEEITALGFDGVLYTYIPKVLITSNFYRPPVFQTSDNYAPGYLQHYADAEFHKVDPLIKAVENGVNTPIDWWSDTNHFYADCSILSKEVMDVSRHYGIVNGITLPLMSDARGIAGASLISSAKHGFTQLKSDAWKPAELRIKLYHNTVLASSNFSSEFMKPVLSSMSDTQLGYMLGIIDGDCTKTIARELNTTRAFLDQSMRKMRQRFSGVIEPERPELDRNQLMYFFGATNLIDHIKRKKQ